MPANICPICNYANIASTEECINCGVPLLGPPIPERRMVPEKARTGPINAKPAGTTTSLRGEIVSTTPENQTRQLTRQEYLPAARPEVQPYPVQGGEQQRGMVSYREPALAPAQSDESPYTGSMDMQPYYQQPSPFQTRVLEETPVEDPEAWKSDPLPWHLPRRRPKLAGKIISMRNEMEFPDYPNLLRALADLMGEFLWIAANQPSHKEGERVQVTILRIRTEEGRLKDARIMGYMRGADLTLGDQVSFWGWTRRGSLLVRTGYNHTSKATITTNMMSMLMPGLILLAIVSGIMLFAAYHSQIIPWFFWLKHLLWPGH